MTNMIFILITMPVFLFGQNCGFDSFQKDERFYSVLNDNEHRIQEIKRNFPNQVSNRNNPVIPIVFHIVWHHPEENISDIQIQSQIDILNRDYNANNLELKSIPDDLKEFSANVGTTFCLASKMENGKRIIGVTRTYYPNESLNLDDLYFSSKEGQDAWDTKKYLNVWVTNLPEGLLGYATPPNLTSPNKDGVLIDYQNFGSVGSTVNNFPYHLGRTLTHEIGHYFNLLHPWGRQRGECEEDDLVADTPIQEFPVYDCNNHSSSCGSMDNYWNFMDFLDDNCMGLFTQGQKQRILDCLFFLRPELLEYNNCSGMFLDQEFQSSAISIFPNPTSTSFSIFIETNSMMNNNSYYLTLFGQAGKKFIKSQCIFAQEIYTFEFPPNSPKGIYYIQVKSKNSVLSKKIIRQ